MDTYVQVKGEKLPLHDTGCCAGFSLEKGQNFEFDSEKAPGHFEAKGETLSCPGVKK
ncbi:MAG: hypothetical protein KDA65_10515 [Planctomycetaceae bacterium]|nr:hypothetical protein [Planctomycetaceae bacterium]